MLRFLVVDDEPGQRWVVESMLSTLGVSVGAGSVAEGLERYVDSGPFDVVLVDYRMGGAKGSDLAKALRWKDERLPIIAMSGGLTPAEMAEFWRSGCCTLLEKPFTETELMACVLERLERKNKLESEVYTAEVEKLDQTSLALARVRAGMVDKLKEVKRLRAVSRGRLLRPVLGNVKSTGG
jgi:DNA-binding NtrC family response regulator